MHRQHNAVALLSRVSAAILSLSLCQHHSSVVSVLDIMLSPVCTSYCTYTVSRLCTSDAQSRDRHAYWRLRYTISNCQFVWNVFTNHHSLVQLINPTCEYRVVEVLRGVAAEAVVVRGVDSCDGCLE